MDGTAAIIVIHTTPADMTADRAIMRLGIIADAIAATAAVLASASATTVTRPTAATAIDPAAHGIRIIAAGAAAAGKLQLLSN